MATLVLAERGDVRAAGGGGGSGREGEAGGEEEWGRVVKPSLHAAVLAALQLSADVAVLLPRGGEGAAVDGGAGVSERERAALGGMGVSKVRREGGGEDGRPEVEVPVVRVERTAWTFKAP